MIIITVGTPLLQAARTEIFVAMAAIVPKLLLMPGAQRERVDLVDAFKLMPVHHAAAMMILGALFAELKLLVGAVHFGSSILAVHARKLII